MSLSLKTQNVLKIALANKIAADELSAMLDAAIFLAQSASAEVGGYNVVGLGAVGNGTTDDTAFIQATIDGAEDGSTILFPNPSVAYKISAPISIANRHALKLVFSKGGPDKINIKNTGTGAAFEITASTYCSIFDAAVQNTETSSGIGFLAQNLSYEIDLYNCHVTDGKAGIQIGHTTGGDSFHIRTHGFTARSASDSATTLKYGVLLYAANNCTFRDTYIHKCENGLRRIVPGGDPLVDGMKCSNLKLDYFVAESCDKEGFYLDAPTSIKFERAYCEGWGAADATPTSYGIKLTGFTYAQLTSYSEALSWEFNDTQFLGQGSIAGGGNMFSLTKFFQTANIQKTNSSIPRTTFLFLDDEDATVYGQFTAKPIVTIKGGRTYGTIERSNSQAFITEDDNTTGGNANLDNLAPGIKSHIDGVGVGRGLILRSTVGSAKFSPLGFGIVGQPYMNLVVDNEEIGFNKFPSNNPNAGFDSDRGMSISLNDQTRGWYTTSQYWGSRLRQRFNTSGVVQFQATAYNNEASYKQLELNPSGGAVKVGTSTYSAPTLLGSQNFWMESTRLRTKSSTPGSSTDGAVVGGYTYDLKRDFAATGDGTTDDTTAWNNAMTAISGSSGKSLWVPVGTYKISATVALNETDGCVVVGENPYSTKLVPTNALDGLPMMKWTDCRDGVITNIHFEGNQAHPPSAAIEFARAAASSQQSTHNTVRTCIIGSTYNGFDDAIQFTCEGGADTNNDLHQIVDCSIYNIPGNGINIGHSNSLVHTISGCDFTNVGTGIYGAAGSAYIENNFFYCIDYDFQLGMDTAQTQGYHPWYIIDCYSESGTALIARAAAAATQVFWRGYERQGGPAGVLSPISFTGTLNVWNFNQCRIFLGQPTQHFDMSGSAAVVTIIDSTMSFTHYDGCASGSLKMRDNYHTPGTVSYAGLSSTCTYNRGTSDGPAESLNTTVGRQSATVGLTFRGDCDDGSTAVANIFDSSATLTGTAKIASFRNGGVEKSFVVRDGSWMPWSDGTVNLGFAGNRWLGVYCLALRDPNSMARVEITANAGNTFRGTASNGTYQNRFGPTHAGLTSGNILELHNDTGFTKSLFGVNYIGKRVYPATGTADVVGTATLVGGTKTVATTAVKTGDIIKVFCNTPGGTQGFLSAPTASIVDSTSFVINSSSGSDTSTVNWEIIHQG